MNSSYNILEVVPHGKPMSLLDEILSYDDSGLKARLTITEASMFSNASGVPAWVGIEYMAQAVAAFAGVCARSHEKAVKIGFLVGSRRYQSSCSEFPLGANLNVEVEEITDNDVGLRVFACKIEGDDIRVDANLNVFMPDDVDEFLEKGV